jgi:hypothetical protein
MWVYPLVMTEIIFSQVLKLFIKQFSIWFKIESKIGENRTYRTQTWPWMKREARQSSAGLAGPWARLGGPLSGLFQSLRAWFLFHCFMNLMIFVVGSCFIITVCFPHTCFLFTFIQNMWRQTHIQKNREQIIAIRFHWYHMALYYNLS